MFRIAIPAFKLRHQRQRVVVPVCGDSRLTQVSEDNWTEHLVLCLGQQPQPFPHQAGLSGENYAYLNHS